MTKELINFEENLSQKEYEDICLPIAQKIIDLTIDEINKHISNKQRTSLFSAFVLMDVGINLFEKGFKEAKRYGKDNPVSFTQILDDAILFIESLRELD